MQDTVVEASVSIRQAEKLTWPHFLWLSLLAALLQILSFPTVGWSFLAFVCWIPLLHLVSTGSNGKLFGFYFLSGFVFQIGNLYWITHVIQHYSSLSTLLSVGVLLLLCLAIALMFWGPFGLMLGWICRRSGLWMAMLTAPFLWAVMEWARCHLTHFPWCFLGYSQYKNLRVAQMASLFGVYGLSCLLMAFNASVTYWLNTRRYSYVAIVTALLITACTYGHFRIRMPAGGETVNVGCIQGNIPQDVKLSYEFAEDVNQRHLEMSEELIRRHRPSLIFWPEASTMFPIRSGSVWTQQILNLAKKHQTALVVGSDTYIHDEVWNSAYFINSQGVIEGSYDKVYLVPFGEYVPYRSILVFVDKVVPEISDFSPGTNYEPFSFEGGKFGVQICFEVVFPQLSREFCKRGAGFLATITNDAWFGRTAAPYQHFAMAAMRSIETRRYLVRAANTGISGIVDPYGRILQTTGLFEPAMISAEVKWIRDQTFYTRHGDILIIFAGFFCGAIVLLGLRKEKTVKP